MNNVYLQSFQHAYHIGDTQLMSELENNMKAFLDWSFLTVGGFTNVDIATSGIYGGDYSLLRKADDPNYSDGQVWETMRKDWVYETGVPSGHNPALHSIYAVTGVHISGIGNVPSSGIVTGTGPNTGIGYAHHYNYPLGRVVFNDPIDTGSVVQVKHAYRNVQTYLADDTDWWTELQFNSLRSDDTQFTQVGSGDWSIGANHRVQMPVVIVEAVPRRRNEGLELGSTALTVRQDVVFHVLAETRRERNNILDMIVSQHDAMLQLFHTDAIAAAGAFPLDFNGSLKSNPVMYTGLTSTYPFQRCRFHNGTLSEMQSFHPQLHGGTVRLTCEVVLGNA